MKTAYFYLLRGSGKIDYIRYVQSDNVTESSLHRVSYRQKSCARVTLNIFQCFESAPIAYNRVPHFHSRETSVGTNRTLDDFSGIPCGCFRWRGDRVEREVPAGQKLPGSLRHHHRVEAGAANRARSWEKIVHDDDRHDACRSGPVDADGVQANCRSEPVATETRDHPRITATSQRWLCARHVSFSDSWFCFCVSNMSWI